jgi:hypothetical protein
MEAHSTRERIAWAVQCLLDSDRLVTRKSIAELAQCNLRTVSNHKDLWKDHVRAEPPKAKAPEVHTDERLVSAVRSLLSETQKIENPDELASIQAAVRWFRQIAEQREAVNEVEDLFRLIEAELGTRISKKEPVKAP